MRAYDFDETIYDGDSTRDFYFYCLKNYPRICLALPMQGWHFLLYMCGVHTKTAFKERFYRFFRLVPDMEKAVSDFWDTHFSKIKPWYLAQKEPTDVIISASPAFLLEMPCKRLGLPAPIASLADMHTGKYTGENCYGKEKPPRFYALYPEAVPEAFYSDSLSDTPMAEISRESFIVRGDAIIPWKSYVPSPLSRLRRALFSPAFVRFVLIGAASTLLTTALSLFYGLFLPESVSAFALGYLSTLLISFLVNCAFTFKKAPGILRFFRYVLSYIPNFILQCGLVWLFGLLHFAPALAYLLAAVLGVPMTFLFLKVFTFKK